MSDLILSIFTAGPPEHRRYQIADPYAKLWTGDDWTEEESEARLFASINDAAQAIQEIQLAQHGHKPLRRFIAPVQVDLYAETSLTPDDISDWLVKVARLTIDAEKHGNGPTEGTLGLCHIDWSKLKEISSG